MTTTKTTLNSVKRPDWLTNEVWPYEVRSIEVDDTTVAYTDEGNGPQLLLVHDGMWSYVWGQLIELLRSEFRVVTLDFPGSGLSPETNRPVGLRSDAELLEQFVSAVGLDDMTLVLHDLGGPVGLGLALRRPESINGAVFMNTFAWPPQLRRLRAMFAVMTSGPATAINVTTNTIPRLTSGRGGIGRHLDPAERTPFVRGFDRPASRRRFHQLMESVRDQSDLLIETEALLRNGFGNRPALSIYGQKNDPFGFQARIATLLPQVEEMVIEGGNHFPMCDEPENVADRIRAWHRRTIESTGQALLHARR